MAKRQQIEQNFLLRGIGKSWVGFRYVRISTCQHSLNPQNWGCENSPFKLLSNGSRWSNTLKWEALWNHCSCNLQIRQNIQFIRIKVCRLKNLRSTSVALVPKFLGFSCYYQFGCFRLANATRLTEQDGQIVRNLKTYCTIVSSCIAEHAAGIFLT